MIAQQVLRNDENANAVLSLQPNGQGYSIIRFFVKVEKMGGYPGPSSCRRS
jgi:hypothetical protein